MEQNNHDNVWNREQLYAEIWEQPASKIAKKYGVSDVFIGKVCRKFQYLDADIGQGSRLDTRLSSCHCLQPKIFQ
jgi:hypothetical protein